ncbi:MAG TPA: hypothetical protein VEY12_06375, partial [Thermoplasmata archaeon]|nr:hypothetical protein [Thermoplasmata archaeon]
MKERTLFLAIFASVALVTWGFGIYAATWKPNVVVTDGSITGVIKGNLTSITPAAGLVEYFNATTYVNESGAPGSTLVLEVRTVTYYVAPPRNWPNASYYQGYLWTGIWVTFLGHFAPDLTLRNLQLTANGTGVVEGTSAADSFNFLYSFLTGANISFAPSGQLGFLGTGSVTILASFLNETGTSSYDFAGHALLEATGFLGHDRHVGLQVGVTCLGGPVRVRI